MPHLALPSSTGVAREHRGDRVCGEQYPAALVEEKDIRGTFHCHTTYSDGLGTLEQMAQAAAGLDGIPRIADHSKAAAYARGLTRADVKRQFRRSMP